MEMEDGTQYELERQFPYSPQADFFFSMTHEERIDADRRSIYVGNVDYGATADELEMYFNSCGHINRVTIPYNRFTGHPKGFAYIEFSDRDSVRTAMALDETLFRGRLIKVLPKRTNVPGFRTTDRYLRGGWTRGRGYRPSRLYSPLRGCNLIRENGGAHPWIDSF
ncbi:embryonic polyadenylate-binding protein 2 [Triplophysa dalaica]|uniref:embryonic polyadenylate-binding protein 2 n=1 Tax=Triplophysa dalaica TaxID=1582913 RepID=UPI0024DF8B9D|nr:embryonic polyadenylate-binding protein 2 [Triplophysa dalaica]XP_056611824.1 embryonic polyadenylate-binding protein 2 [Triplophysa dalaica]